MLADVRFALKRPHRRTILLAVLFVLVEYVYVFLCTARTFDNWPTYNNYYDLLAEGFRAGHLNIAADPSAELLAKPNPYDHANSHLWMWDVSLYKGKYYLYWGPTPAILQALAKSALRIRGLIGDQYLVFTFFSLSALSGALLVDRMAKRLFGTTSIFVVGLAFLAFAFSNPAPYLVATPGVYQAAIAGGQAFLLLGLVPAFDAVWRANEGATPRVKLALAGAAWVMALGSRISLAPAVGLLVVVTAVLSGRSRGGRWTRIVRDCSWIALPLAIGSFALLLYNKMRFDSWLEFGHSTQLDTLTWKLSPKYLVANLYQYFISPPELSCHFPFLVQWWDHGIQQVPGWVAAGDGYYVQEPVVGALLVVPVIWCAWFSVPKLLSFDPRRTVAWSNQGAYLWCVLAFAISGSLTAGLDFSVLTATMRYLADFTFGLVLLGILGGFTLRSSLRGRWTRALGTIVIVGTSLGTVVMGLLLGFQGYNNQFAIHNPPLYEKVVHKLSLCK